MLLSSASITKHHGDKCILNAISFSIEEQDKIAVLGVNGTGKSTFLKIIAGVEDYQGTIIRKNNITISYLPQNPDFNKELTIWEQVFKIIDKKEVEDFEVKSILTKLGISNHHQKIKELSGGQEKRVALAITLLTPCDLLILDEPTNHLDSSMIEYLEKYLIRFNKALLMVTHDRYFLERITKKIYEIDRSSLYEYPGNYSQYLELKAKREEDALMAQKKRNSFLRKEIEWVRAGVQARSTKSKERLERFHTLNSIDKIESTKDVELIALHSRLGKKTIILDEVSKSFDNTILFQNFSYTFKRHDRIGILGDNGSGKSTLLNIIGKELSPTSGTITYGDTIKIGYFKQGTDDMDYSMKVIDYIRETANYITTNQGQLSAKQMCERFLFDSHLQHSKIEKLSGGEKRRLYLLKILLGAPNVLLFDEPTNDLDINTLAILEDYLDSFPGIVIIVSHDRYFLDRICDGMFVFKDKVITKHNGGYSQYLDTATTDIKTKTDGAKRYAMEKQQQRQNTPRLSSKEKQELENMETFISSLEEEVLEIDNKMSHSQDNFEEISILSTKREELLKKIDESSERWMYLLEIQEQINNSK
ncbi:MAG: ABC-F family ATP-binding cassette domain-containing protein [Coprobacillaceae bacterium]